MSDTPLDYNLDHKSSTRKPEFMAERIEEFREEYNDAIREMPLDDGLAETFILRSDSDARRRLIDMGLSYFVEHAIPFGFAFDPATHFEDPADCYCVECGETDPWMFRLGGNKSDAGNIEFTKIRCLSCNTTNTRAEIRSPTDSD
jgi:hypothetical protein